MKNFTKYTEINDYVTKDGSIIRELLHPGAHAVSNQSLAEAIVPPGTTTRLHAHNTSEEIYHITSGKGLMTLGEQQFEVEPGDSIVIAPRTPHCIQNNSAEPLKILCCCAPAYQHEDTILLRE